MPRCAARFRDRPARSRAIAMGSELARESEPIAQRNHANGYARVGMYFEIEGADAFRIRVSYRRVNRPAVPEDVVGRDQATGAHQFQSAIEVVRVIHFIGVDKYHVETAGLAFGE